MSEEREERKPEPSAFAWAIHNDPTVNAMLRGNRCHTEIIGVMAQEKRQLFARVMELELIAPKKVTLSDGRVMIYRCPDHLLMDAAINPATEPPL